MRHKAEMWQNYSGKTQTKGKKYETRKILPRGGGGWFEMGNGVSDLICIFVQKG
jgi:hypothetical protein